MHDAVEGDALARFHAHGRADGHRGDGYLLPRTAGVGDRGRVGRQLHQAVHGVARTVQRQAFDQFGDGEQEDDHGRFRPLADGDGAEDCQAHQEVDVQGEGFQGNPALFQGRPAARGDRQQGQGDDEGRTVFVRGPRQRLGARRSQAGNHQQAFLQAAQAAFIRVARNDRVRFHGNRLHADAVQGRFHRGQRGQGVVHIEHAVHQIEIEAHHAGHRGQLVADQAFFRRAIHVGDAVLGRARAGDGGAGQGRRGRGGRRRSACMLAGTATGRLGRSGRGAFVLVLVLMLMLMVVLMVVVLRVFMAIVRHRIIFQDSCMLSLETL